MPFLNGEFTSEAVSPGHPDKVCDQISDAILDAFLRLDPQARVACETLAADNKIILAGEFRTRDPSHFAQVRDTAPQIVRAVLREIGFGSSALDIDPDKCEVEVRFNHQSPQIAAGVDHTDGLIGAGDQGLMFGYATNETKELMPLPWALAMDLIGEARSLAGGAGSPLRPDGKSQVTVAYRDGKPIGVRTVVLSWQHQPNVPVEALRDYLLREVIDRVVPPDLRAAGFRTLINPSGAWTIGGPKGDTGLTGRKIIVDTYGGACPHGGGAFSGKDPSKVDRSGAYAARYIAKHVVAAGLSSRCTVQVAYAIGTPQPVSLCVALHGTGTVPERVVNEAVRQVFDLTPSGIIRELDLLRPNYQGTAMLGHFGGWREPTIHLWEQTPRIAELRGAVSGLQAV